MLPPVVVAVGRCQVRRCRSPEEGRVIFSQVRHEVQAGAVALVGDDLRNRREDRHGPPLPGLEDAGPGAVTQGRRRGCVHE